MGWSHSQIKRTPNDNNRHSTGKITKSQVRSRYQLMFYHHTYPTMIILNSVPQHAAPAHEAALIGLTLPTANNLERSFGVAGQRQTLGHKSQHAKRSRATTRHRLASHLLQDVNINHQASTHHRQQLQYTSRLRHDEHECKKAWQPQSLQQFLRSPFPQIY